MVHKMGIIYNDSSHHPSDNRWIIWKVGHVKCPQCNTEIQQLRKKAGAGYWLAVIVSVIVFFPLAIIIILCQTAEKPDECPVCFTKLKLKTVTEDGVRVKKFVKKGWLD